MYALVVRPPFALRTSAAEADPTLGPLLPPPFLSSRHTLVVSLSQDGVTYLHSKNIIHRDLKPENVLYRTPPGSHPDVGHDDLVLSDFGLAAYVERNGGRLYTVAGSAGYSAPEMYPEEGVVNGQGQGRGYGLKADVWSLGIIGASFFRSPGSSHRLH